MPPERVTLQQIADRCGVSRNTVSLALRGARNRMKPETFERIQQVSREMGYVKDAQLSTLTRYLAH